MENYPWSVPDIVRCARRCAGSAHRKNLHRVAIQPGTGGGACQGGIATNQTQDAASNQAPGGKQGGRDYEEEGSEGAEDTRLATDAAKINKHLYWCGFRGICWLGGAPNGGLHCDTLGDDIWKNIRGLSLILL